MATRRQLAQGGAEQAVETLASGPFALRNRHRAARNVPGIHQFKHG